MPLAEGASFAGYTIIRLLGTGAMGEVYLARHPRLPRDDALKVLTASVSPGDEHRLRFDREADLVAALWHPNIVGVHDRGESDGKLWIAMDYVEGTDAGELMRAHPSGLPPHEVTRIVNAVAEALDYAHHRHLLHRDVKPPNILVTNDDPDEQRILLADFGIARRDDDADGLTATDMTVGTVAYAAPEQLMGKPLDGRADQYALAATAYHLLTGCPPFSHSNNAVVISQHLTATPPKLSQRRPDLAHLDPALSKALSKNPADRYPRCVDFARALSTGLGAPDGSTELASAAGQLQHGGPGRRDWLRPQTLVPAIIGILLVAAVAFALGSFAGKHASRRTDMIRPGTTTAGVPTSAPTTSATQTPTDLPNTAVQPPAAAVGSAVVGSRCENPGATDRTAEAAITYCARLQYTDRYLWSLSPGEIPNPVVTTPPAATPPYEEESPVLVCMQQTGHSRMRCTGEILRGNSG